ncbi:MAG TPA: hypothetical protein G4O00_10960 [Thermoflexia bacterium]|nr:hypothetical protein [Thermoflexia bacterium]
MQPPIPSAELLYKDPNAEKVLRVLPKVLEQVDRPVCDHDRPIPGLPIMPGRWPEWTEHNGEYLARTPWGLAETVYGSEIGGDDVYAVTPVWRIVVPDGQRPYPGAVVPVPSVAVLDMTTGMVSVYADGSDEPIHHLRLGPDTLEGADGWDLAKVIRRRLCRDRIPVYPTAIYTASRFSYPYPLVRGGHLTKAAYVANKEIGVPLVGYAVATYTEEVVYLHIIGHKTAVRSIWATLNGRAGNAVQISAPGISHRAYSSQNYVTYSDPVDADLGLVRLVIVDRRAVDREVVGSEAYLVAPDTTNLDLNQAFATRLDAVLPIPILPEWGSALRKEGERHGLVKACRHGGDVGTALAVVPDVERWQILVEGLVRSGELTW